MVGTQRAARDVLLHEVELSVELLEREDGRDAGMRERPGRHRLAPQPGAHPVVVGERRRQGLDGDGPPQARVVAEVDDPHPATSEEAGHLVGAEPPSDQRIVCAGQEQAGIHLHRRPVDDTGPAVHLQQRQHLGAQGLVAGARLLDERFSIVGLAFERGVEQLVDPAPALSVHRGRPA